MGGKRIDAVLCVKRPYYVDDIRDGDAWDQLRRSVQQAGGATALRTGLKRQGYDGIVLNGTRLDGVIQNTIIVFEPEQIRRVAIRNTDLHEPHSSSSQQT